MSRPIVLDTDLNDEQRPIAQRVVTDRPHLVRGVAGSGKTLTLTRNLAHRLVQLDQNPPARMPRIAVLCFNRCLVPLILERTADAYRELSGGQELDPRRVVFTHMNGFIYRMSKHPNARAEGWGGPLVYRTVNSRESDAERRASDYLKQLDRLTPTELEPYLFDTIYIDEGQDFTEVEFKLILRLMRPASPSGERNLIVFYDNAQNLYARKPPTWSALGVQIVGRTDVMKRCMRNTAEVVDLALNVLVGPENTRTGTRQFADLETLRRDELIDESGDIIRTRFTTRSGPVPLVAAFDSETEEYQWVTGHIDALLSEGLPPEEILVVARNQEYAERIAHAIKNDAQWVNAISKPHLREEKDRPARRTGFITVTTPESAKGYDADVVFVVGAHQFVSQAESRASFYVACTRSKRQLMVSGVGADRGLLAESLNVRARRFPIEGDLPCPVPPPPKAAPTPMDLLRTDLDQVRRELAERDRELSYALSRVRELEERNRELERRPAETPSGALSASVEAIELRKLQADLAETEQMWSETEAHCENLQNENNQLKAKVIQLEADLQRSDEKRAWAEQQHEEILRLSLESLLPQLNILPQSYKALTQVGFEPNATLEFLGALNADLATTPPRATRVKAASGWFDIHVNSGKSDDGRIYFSKVGGDGRREILIGRKSQQSQHINMLKGLAVK